MPKEFNECLKNKGHVITKKLSKDRYILLCRTKEGKWVKGEEHVKSD